MQLAGRRRAQPPLHTSFRSAAVEALICAPRGWHCPQLMRNCVRRLREPRYPVWIHVQNFVDIADGDYQQRRHASELAAWVNAKFRDLEAGGRLEEQYFERRGRNVKRLVEEAVPISRLGLYLWKPGDEPHITLLPNPESFDGLVEVEGFSTRSFSVEVTSLETEDSTLRRQALSREGTVPLVGRIQRRAGVIISEMEMVDVDERTDATVQLALDRLRAKVESGAYSRNTAILVYLSELWPLPREGRLTLRKRTQQYLTAEPRGPTLVYYCFWPELSVEAVEVRRPAAPTMGAA
jgi:hypothetical protein